MSDSGVAEHCIFLFFCIGTETLISVSFDQTFQKIFHKRLFCFKSCLFVHQQSQNLFLMLQFGVLLRQEGDVAFNQIYQTKNTH